MSQSIAPVTTPAVAPVTTPAIASVRTSGGGLFLSIESDNLKIRSCSIDDRPWYGSDFLEEALALWRAGSPYSTFSIFNNKNGSFKGWCSFKIDGPGRVQFNYQLKDGFKRELRLLIFKSLIPWFIRKGYFIDGKQLEIISCVNTQETLDVIPEGQLNLKIYLNGKCKKD